MLLRQFTHCILRPSDLESASELTQVVGTFNPGAESFGQGVAVVARVAEEAVEKRSGRFSSPRYEGEELRVDWLDQDDCDCSDPRIYVMKTDGTVRLRFVSHLRVYFSEDGRTIDAKNPLATILPEGEYESFGIEDPRVTRIGSTYYITYVGVSPHGVCTRLMSTTDFKLFKRHGTIFCPDNKDVVLFPEKVLGEYIALHRPMPSMKFSPPQVWLARSPDLMHWGKHLRLLGGVGDGSSRDRVGGGTPPIMTDRGWLTLYHGSDKKPSQEGAGVYSAGALLLDADNPGRVIAKSLSPVMKPEAPFEKNGFVENVVFPTAMIRREGMLFVYYGAADENLAVCGFDIQDVLDACEAV